MAYLLSAIFLGWSLGANDAANIFGTAVSSRMIKFITAVILASVFVFLGAVLEGSTGIETIGEISSINLTDAGYISLASALTVTLMTLLKLPVSTSQAVVGAIVGLGIIKMQFGFVGLEKIILCWIGTPVGGRVFSIILYLIFAFFLNKFRPSWVTSDFIIRAGLVIVGCYGAYALGANNVANVTGVFYGAGYLSIQSSAIIGGLSIALGILTFSKGVMMTVGRGIIRLDGFSAFIVVLANSITVHIYAEIGVPVSTSQAVVGAVIGIGILKRAEAIRTKSVMSVLSGWITSPIIAALLSITIYFVTHLEYVG
jgi:PiT family inorganic phosphate transporter